MKEYEIIEKFQLEIGDMLVDYWANERYVKDKNIRKTCGDRITKDMEKALEKAKADILKSAKMV